ncbi:hypothetical protein ACWKWN_18370 [Microbacterium trichothecenolyticum]
MALAFVSPPLALAPLLVLALPLMFRLKALAAVTALAMLFGTSAQAVTQSAILGYADEALIALFVGAAVVSRVGSKRRLVMLPGMLPLGIFVALGLVSGLVGGVSFPLGAASAFIALKGWLFALGLAQIAWDRAGIRQATWFAGIVLAVAIAGTLANLALGPRWADLWNGAANYHTRWGLPALGGLFGPQLVAGNVMACAFLLVLVHALTFGWSARHAFLLVGSGASVALSGRRTAAVGLALGSVWAGLRTRRASTLLQVVLVAPLVVILGWSTITEAVENAFSDYVERGATAARTIMHTDMWSVASSHFPLGAGFGRFGSFLAGQDYSPEYIARGYLNIWGLSKVRGNDTFLTDTQWPMIIGEPGYIGAVFAIIALGCLVVAAWRAAGSGDPVARWLGLSFVVMTILAAIASYALPVFFGGSPIQVPYYGAIGILVGYLASRPIGDATPEPTMAIRPSRAR